MATTSSDVIAPKALIIPDTGISGAGIIANAVSGQLVMSGSKLYFSVGAGLWAPITSGTP